MDASRRFTSLGLLRSAHAKRRPTAFWYRPVGDHVPLANLGTGREKRRNGVWGEELGSEIAPHGGSLELTPWRSLVVRH